MTTQTPARGFDQGEFEQRTQRAQRMMRERELALMLLSTEPEVRYFTGFLTQFWESPTRPWFVLVPREGKPVAVIPRMGEPVMAATWVDDIRSWSSPRPDDEGVSLLVDAIRELAGDRARVGVPMGPESHLRMALADYTRLQAALPGVSFVDASPVIRSLRMIKSEAEIAKIRHICTIASEAFRAVPSILSQGMPLSAAFRRFRIELLDRGADDVPYVAGASEPGGYSNVIAPPTERPLTPGDVLMMDTGAVFDGYFCDFDRNYSIGPANDALRRGYRTLMRSTQAAFDIARPGSTSSDLFRAMQKVIDEDGFGAGTVGRLGHGLGMQLTEWPSHMIGDETPLAPGMVITLEPGLHFGPGKGIVHEENLVIREGGAEYLTYGAPEEIPEIR